MDRGWVEDHPQKATYRQISVWAFSRRTSHWTLLRLVFDTAAIQFANDPAELFVLGKQPAGKSQVRSIAFQAMAA